MTGLEKRFSIALAAALLGPAPASAHAADQGFILLLPTTAYITGGVLAVAASILLTAFLRPGALKRAFAPRETGPTERPDTASPDPASANPASLNHAPPVIAVISSALLAALIAIGLFGPTDPQANLLPLTLWTVWWMALFTVQALVFDVWRWVNPFIGLHWLLFPKNTAPLTMPRWVSVWPAVGVFAAFQGFVLADVAPNDPDRLAMFAIGYWLFALAGMSLFGRSAWLRHGECFTVLFTLLGELRPFDGARRLRFGPPGWRLGETARFDLSHAALVLVLLAAGSFDGLHETFWWLAQIGVNPLEYPGRSAVVWPTTIGLYGAVLLLTLIFAAAVWVGLSLARRPSAGFAAAFTAFALSLLPIAIGYHVAHYLVTFLVQIQVTIATLADPLARGWNLLGLEAMRVKVGFLTVPGVVKVIWLTQAGVVVVSHILAVLLGHRAAERICASRGDVLRVQAGLSLLMIAYTIFGLWLLASPRGA